MFVVQAGLTSVQLVTRIYVSLKPTYRIYVQSITQSQKWCLTRCSKSFFATKAWVPLKWAYAPTSAACSSSTKVSKGDRFQSRGPQYTVKAGTWSATQLIGGLIIDPYPSPSMSSDPRIFFQIFFPDCKMALL